MTAVRSNTLEETMPKQEVDYGAMDVDTAINPETEETTPKTRRTRTTTYGLLLFVLSVVLVVAGAGVTRSSLRYDTTASIVVSSTSDHTELVCGPTEYACDEKYNSRGCCDMPCPKFEGIQIDTKYDNPSDKNAYCDTDKKYQTCWDFVRTRCYCQTDNTGLHQEAAEPCQFCYLCGDKKNKCCPKNEHGVVGGWNFHCLGCGSF